MQIEAIQPGRYVVAVSGGVDSMVLLDVLRQEPGLELVVAHFEHGIRSDSDEDRKLVEQVADQYGLPFFCEHGSLGAGASEAAAREARYAFLQRVRTEQGAQAIVAAHHQDDLLETAVINILRGTGRKGLSSLQSTDAIVRPLLHVSKSSIYDYAHAHGIVWREDSTNTDDTYLRNHVRRHILPKLGPGAQHELLGFITRASAANPIIDQLLAEDIAAHTIEGGLQRAWFILLPHDISCEVMAAWLRQNNIRTFDRKIIERLVVLVKTAYPGKQGDITAGYSLKVGKTIFSILPRTTS